MRRIILQQPSIVETTGSHQHTTELRKLDEILRSLPRIAGLVLEDLVRGLKDPRTGRRGNLTADQVVRVLLVKQMNGFSYEQLAFHLPPARKKSGEPDILGAARGTAKELSHFVGLAKKVIDQTERRVVKQEQVPAQEKVVSIFEPHTDIIIKDQRETRYGHKVVLTGGVSGLFTDMVVLDGNPADSTLALNMVQRQETIFDRVPLKVAFDGGFASKANLQQIKDLGVRDVTFVRSAASTSPRWPRAPGSTNVCVISAPGSRA